MSQGSWQREQVGAGCRQQPQPGRDTACVNNCGFFGNETTLNMCPNCYRTYMSSEASTGAQPLSPGLTSPSGSPGAPSQAPSSGSQRLESVDMLSGETDELVFPQDSDSSLLERTSTIDASLGVGPGRTRFPRVNSASEAARDVDASVPKEDPGASKVEKAESMDLKTDAPADSLVRTNATRMVDMDVHEKLAFSPASPAILGSPSPSPAALAAAPALPRTSASGSSSKPNRCGVCKKKVGLTGFKCRCSGLFCGSHRYSDKHSCTFDYKAAGREAIAKANPVVKADKVVRF